jgi:hypothetical protein
VKVLVVRSEEGKIVEKNILEGELADIAKTYAEKAFKEWDPARSDFTVLKSKYERRIQLPIDPDLLDAIEALNLEKRIEPNELVVEIPLITISFDNEWIGENYHEKKMYIIVPYLDAGFEEEILRYAIDATREAKNLAALEGETGGLTLSEEELKRLEEGLEEIEQAEKKQKKRRSRRRKKKQA